MLMAKPWPLSVQWFGESQGFLLELLASETGKGTEVMCPEGAGNGWDPERTQKERAENSRRYRPLCPRSQPSPWSAYGTQCSPNIDKGRVQHDALGISRGKVG